MANSKKTNPVKLLRKQIETQLQQIVQQINAGPVQSKQAARNIKKAAKLLVQAATPKIKKVEDKPKSSATKPVAPKKAAPVKKAAKKAVKKAAKKKTAKKKA